MGGILVQRGCFVVLALIIGPAVNAGSMAGYAAKQGYSPELAWPRKKDPTCQHQEDCRFWAGACGHDAAMVDAQLAPVSRGPPCCGSGKVAPRPVGGGVRHRRVTCARPQPTHDPARAKAIEATAAP